jgi:hypothetical protein
VDVLEPPVPDLLALNVARVDEDALAFLRADCDAAIDFDSFAISDANAVAFADRNAVPVPRSFRRFSSFQRTARDRSLWRFSFTIVPRTLQRFASTGDFVPLVQFSRSSCLSPIASHGRFQRLRDNRPRWGRHCLPVWSVPADAPSTAVFVLRSICAWPAFFGIHSA